MWVSKYSVDKEGFFVENACGFINRENFTINHRYFPARAIVCDLANYIKYYYKYNITCSISRISQSSLDMI